MMNKNGMDFETYSEAGYDYDPVLKKWVSCVQSAPHGLGAVGASVYTEHPSCRLLSLVYDIGNGPQLWVPCLPAPADLFAYIAAGGLINAANSMFEFLVWKNVCEARMGWPPLPLKQLRDTLSKGRAVSMPGALGKLADALQTNTRKDKGGMRLINKFSKPRNPTKNNPALFLDPADDPVDGPNLYSYNVDDVVSEAEADVQLPDLSDTELELWLLDQSINSEGVSIDTAGLHYLAEVVRLATIEDTLELVKITGGAVQSATEIPKMKKWLVANGLPSASQGLAADDVDAYLSADGHPDRETGPVLDPDVRKVLEVRKSLGSASVKKIPAILRRLSADGRLRDLFCYYGGHTGRWAGRGPQPQNLPNSGPPCYACACGRYFGEGFDACPFCHAPTVGEAGEWCPEAVDSALLGGIIESYKNPIKAVGGCLRGLFVARDGYELISSDYSAIEAVVLAQLAGEQWRIDVFNSHGKIYEMSASKITGVPFSEMMDYKKRTGDHHPSRKKIGKVGELASGYQGGVGAWKAFGAGKFMSDAEIKEAIKAWRAESPNIVKFWYGVQDAAISAAQNPGQFFTFRGLMFGMVGPHLKIQLPSRRFLTYNDAVVVPDGVWYGKPQFKLTFMHVHAENKQWCRTDTYGGKLAENITQAVARDILAHAMPKLDAAGYPVVLHIHDEVACEVPIGFGSIEGLERILGDMPEWASDWPIKAAGGWRGRRYRKD